MSLHTEEIVLVCFDENGNSIGEVTMQLGWYMDLPKGTHHVHFLSEEQVRLEP